VIATHWHCYCNSSRCCATASVASAAFVAAAAASATAAAVRDVYCCLGLGHATF